MTNQKENILQVASQLFYEQGYKKPIWIRLPKSVRLLSP